MKTLNIYFLLIPAIVLGLCFNYLFFDKTLGVSAVLFVIIMLVSVAFLIQQSRFVYTFGSVVMAMFMLFFSTLIAIRASDMLVFLNVVSVIMCAFVLAQTLHHHPLSKFSSSTFARLLFFPFRCLRAGIHVVMEDLHTEQEPSASQCRRATVFGILIALPFLVIFSVLFSYVDPVFQHYALNIININITQETIVRFFLVMFVTIAFVSAFALLFRIPAQTSSSFNHSHTVGQIEIFILIGSIAVLFFLFLLLQFEYLFGQSGDLARFGLTYSEYARRGFGELIFATVLCMGILWISRLAHINTQHSSRPFKILGIFLLLENGVLMLSALHRLALYEEAYGLTILRFFSHEFIYWIIVAGVLLGYAIVRRVPDTRIACITFFSFLTFVAFMNVINPDAVIVRHNMNRYRQTGKFDVAYFDRLSSDAVPTIISELPSNHSDVDRAMMWELLLLRKDVDSFSQHGQSANVSDIRAIYRLRNISLLEPERSYLPLEFGN